MKISFENINKKIKKTPGDLIYTGKHIGFPSALDIIEYKENIYNEKHIKSNFNDIKIDKEKNYLLIFEGFSNKEDIQQLNEFLRLHKLTLEDIMNINQRNKFEKYEDYSFFVIKKITEISQKDQIEFSQVSIIKKENMIIIFTEKKYNYIDHIIDRIKNKKGIAHKKNTDYLLYVILDILTDEHFDFSNNIAEKIELIDENINLNPESDDLLKIKRIKQLLIHMRKNYIPLREIYRQLQRGDIDFIDNENLIYFRDLYDHILRLNESLELMKDTTSNLIEIYLSLISNKLNQVMKVLYML